MYYFSEMNFRGNHAGTKARNDVDHILKDFGAIPINSHALELRSDSQESIRSNIQNRLGFLRYYMDLYKCRNQIVFIQYPMLAFDIAFDYVQKLSKHNRVIFLVHDVQSLRREGFSGLDDEIRMLNLADGLVVHNDFMEKKFREIGIKVPHIYCLNCFDYLYNGNISNHKKETGIAFAGNLGKSVFLNDLLKENSQIPFNLYGPGWNEALAENGNAKYCGSFPPDEVPGKLVGRFGLIWDGDTTKECSGVLGEYNKINNPHKMSLYIAAGLPVIVWKEAAVAKFIEKHQIGIAVSSVNDLSNDLKRILPEEYNSMKKNVDILRNKVISGSYLHDVLEELQKTE